MCFVWGKVFDFWGVNNECGFWELGLGEGGEVWDFMWREDLDK